MGLSKIRAAPFFFFYIKLMRRLNMLVNETYEGRNIKSVTESQKKK